MAEGEDEEEFPPPSSASSAAAVELKPTPTNSVISAYGQGIMYVMYTECEKLDFLEE